ncbi:MAG: DUF1828 domain-containing protein [Thermoanaerobaculia bacterium]
MRAAEATTLVDEYLHWLRENLRPAEVPGGVVITTPFLDRHSDEIEIFVQKENGAFLLSDDGYTVADLRAGGIDLTKGSRREQLVRILNGYGVQLEGDALAVNATPAEFPQKKHNLVQAILAVDDLHVTATEQVFQFFREDVEEFLRSQDIPLLRDVKLSGKSGLDHHFDIGLPSDARHPERVLRAINTLRRDTATSFAFSVEDVRNIRGHNALGAFAVVNDAEHPPAAEHLNVLKNYGVVPILWSDRRRARETILAA